MREIKFRAWNGERMSEPFGLFDIYSGHDEAHLPCGMKFYPQEQNKAPEAGWNIFAIMQFTGLHDKNGNPIFEGDIVKSHWYRSDGEWIGGIWEVKYGEHSVDGNDFYSNYAIGFYFDKPHETYNIATIPFDKDKGLEVIGNIWEHPELLKGDA